MAGNSGMRGALTRRWKRFGRLGRGARAAIVVAVVAVLVIGTALVVSAPGHPSPARTAGGAGAGGSGKASPVSSASTSTRGVGAHSITVVFPVVSLNSLAGQEGFAEDTEFGEQQKAIRLFVGQINAAGGINGRKIDPVIATFDPTDEAGMRALCKTWTEGSPAAFAVLDGVGTWTGDNELCITQEGRTPFIGQWTTVTNWTDTGSPYLWWTGPDQAAVLRATVSWGLGAKLIGPGRKVGVIAGDRASDQTALEDYLLPDLRRAGVTPVVKTVAANPTDTASTDSESTLVVEQLQSAGVTSVIPLVPFNVFFAVLHAETDQHYFPKLLLSDYEESIQVSLGLLPSAYGRALDGQEGVTTETLGGVDDDRPEAQGGYDPGVRSCFTTWHRAYPQVPPGNQNFYIEEQGPIAGWCQVIRLFAAAARAAGPHLDRRTFVTAMSRISDFPGTFSPTLSYGPQKRYGPVEYQVVRLHLNSPPSSQCKMPLDHIPQGECWVTVRGFEPLPAP